MLLSGCSANISKMTSECGNNKKWHTRRNDCVTGVLPTFDVFCDLLLGTLSSQDGNAKEDFD